MKNPIESMQHFCLVQLEIIKDREYRLRREIEDCKIQSEFLTQVLNNLGDFDRLEANLVGNLLSTIEDSKK